MFKYIKGYFFFLKIRYYHKKVMVRFYTSIASTMTLSSLTNKIYLLYIESHFPRKMAVLHRPILKKMPFLRHFVLYTYQRVEV